MSGYIGNQVTAQSADSTIYLPVRQTVLTGSATAAGLPNFMAAGTGLRVSLSATATPMVMAFANGFGSYGAQDYVARISANNADMTGADLGASNTNYILATYTNNSTVTWNSTLLPVQYGSFYPQTAQSLLRFTGADASTTILDDYGNTWTAAGNAQVDTAVQINGLNTLLLDGTGDYVENTQITSLGSGSWTMECKVRWNTLPAASLQTVFAAYNGTVACATLALNDTAGTKKLALYASSNGTTQDIANAVLGTSTVWATATTYHIVLTYDALAGKYFVYKDGVAEAALTVTTAAKICAFTKIRIGDSGAGTNQLNGAVAGYRFSPCCRYPNGTGFTAPDISTFAVEGHWFDNVGYQMWEATTASASAGANPTFTQRNRVFVGEADTSGAAVTAVRNYAYQGRYTSDDFAATVNTATNKSHNIGTVPVMATAKYIDQTAEGGLTLGYIAPIAFSHDGTNGRNLQLYLFKNIVLCMTSANPVLPRGDTGAAFTPTVTNLRVRLEINRGW